MRVGSSYTHTFIKHSYFTITSLDVVNKRVTLSEYHHTTRKHIGKVDIPISQIEWFRPYVPTVMARKSVVF